MKVLRFMLIGFGLLFIGLLCLILFPAALGVSVVVVGVLLRMMFILAPIIVLGAAVVVILSVLSKRLDQGTQRKPASDEQTDEPELPKAPPVGYSRTRKGNVG